ncbi:MAG: TolC family protein [Planctomycetaceae bacterium]|nr:TolC family protein [Planctomycetaceae bacterium]
MDAKTIRTVGLLMVSATLIAGSETLWANEPAPMDMTLAQFEAMAEQNNPTLGQAAARVQALQGEWVQAGLWPNPRGGYQANEINDERQAGQQGAYVGQEIVTAGKLRLSRDVAAQAIQQAEHAYAAQRGRVQNDVRRAFYDVLVAQRTVELADQLVRIGQEGVRAAEALFQAKEVAKVDTLQARIEADSARILAEKARNRLTAAWRQLALTVGQPDLPIARVDGNLQEGLPRLTWDESLGRVLAESPELAEARVGVDRAAASVARQRAERMPNVDLQTGVLYDNATRDTIAEVQVGSPWPLFNRNQGNIRKAEAELVVARGEVRRVELELRQRLAAAFELYQNAQNQVDKYSQDILPNAQTSLDLVATGYRHGEFGYVALLTAQRTFFQVNLAYLDAIRDLRSSTVAIEGNLLSGSLQTR